MTDVRRDAALAAVCGALFLGVLVAVNATASLLDPVAVAVGISGALLVEAAFVVETPATALWEHRWVRVVSVAVLVLGVAGLAWLSGPVVVAAGCWGLATYFALLFVLVTGYWPGLSGGNGR